MIKLHVTCNKQNPTKRKILIVEDDKIFSLLITK